MLGVISFHLHSIQSTFSKASYYFLYMSFHIKQIGDIHKCPICSLFGESMCMCMCTIISRGGWSSVHLLEMLKRPRSISPLISIDQTDEVVDCRSKKNQTRNKTMEEKRKKLTCGSLEIISFDSQSTKKKTFASENLKIRILCSN